MNSRLAIVSAVLVLHLAALWALQTGLLGRVVEVIVPAELISELVQEPPPPALPVAPPPRTAPLPVPGARAPTPVPEIRPQVQQIAPTVNAPIAATVPAPMSAPPAPVIASAPPATPARIDLPSSNAEYLNNPAPAYPVMSKRLGEQGKVMVRVLIGTDGTAQKAELQQSSGFERLDQAALNTVLKWRYVPGKRGGIPEAMWFNVPINFVLE